MSSKYSLFYRGEPLVNLADRTGINFYTLRSRVIRGLPHEDVVYKGRLQTKNGNRLNLRRAFFDKVEKTKNCWLWTGSKFSTGYGYLTVGLGSRDNKRNLMATGISLDIHGRGPVGKGQVILHSCDNPICVNPDHLKVGTHVLNMKDMRSKGRQASGERCARSKLKESEAKGIRKELSNSSKAELARKYKVSEHAIYCIANRKTWKHL